ncbi:hypothetical protein FQZ97_846580 [compost metagenome]
MLIEERLRHGRHIPEELLSCGQLGHLPGLFNLRQGRFVLLPDGLLLRIPGSGQIRPLAAEFLQHLQLFFIPGTKFLFGLVDLVQLAKRAADLGRQAGKLGRVLSGSPRNAGRYVAALIGRQVRHRVEHLEALLQLIGELFLFRAQLADQVLVVFLLLLLFLEGLNGFKGNLGLAALRIGRLVLRELVERGLLGGHLKGFGLEREGIHLGLDGIRGLPVLLSILVDDDAGGMPTLLRLLQKISKQFYALAGFSFRATARSSVKYTVQYPAEILNAFPDIFEVGGKRVGKIISFEGCNKRGNAFACHLKRGIGAKGCGGEPLKNNSKSLPSLLGDV